MRTKEVGVCRYYKATGCIDLDVHGRWKDGTSRLGSTNEPQPEVLQFLFSDGM